MICDVCQKHLMLSEDPDNPDLEVSAHLAECQTCRDWQRQLLQIEHNVGRLPAPASSPQAFLDKFLRWPAASTTEQPGSLSSNGGASSPATPDTAHAAVDGSSLAGPAADREVFPTLPFARRWTVRRW